MSCGTCGSTIACNCVRAPVCTTCNSNGNCGCRNNANCITNIVPASPQPFYSCAPTCQESNTQKIVINQFAVALKVANSWNVPACDGSAILTIPGLVSITIGSYIWNAAFGYFEITAFDSGLQQITVVNHCDTGNAAPGTNIPACTEFLNTDPPVVVPNSDICVAIDFTAPAVSTCLDITLTSTVGIGIGDTVGIGAGFYRVDAIKPNDIITICNEGEGITPGTPVIAGTPPNYNYCLQIIATSPCLADVITEGNLVACGEDGQVTTIAGMGSGMVPVQIDDQGLVEFRPILPTQFCTKLTAPLNMVAATATYNNFAVETSFGYSPGTLIVIGSYDNPMRVTAQPDGTHLSGTFVDVPVITFTFPTDTLVCTAPCCINISDILGPTTDGAQCDFNMGQAIDVPGDVISGDGPGGTLTSLDPDADGPPGDWVIINDSSCKNMAVSLNILYRWALQGVTFDPEDFINIVYTPMLGFATGPIGSTVPPAPLAIYALQRTYSAPITVGRIFADLTDSHTTHLLIVPNSELRIRAVTRVSIYLTPPYASSPSATIEWQALENAINGSGVAV